MAWSITGTWNLLSRTPGRNSQVPSVGSPERALLKSETGPVWPAPHAADWPRLAAGWGSPRRALALRAASGEPTCWLKSVPAWFRQGGALFHERDLLQEHLVLTADGAIALVLHLRALDVLRQVQVLRLVPRPPIAHVVRPDVLVADLAQPLLVALERAGGGAVMHRVVRDWNLLKDGSAVVPAALEHAASEQRTESHARLQGHQLGHRRRLAPSRSR